jgi:2OG-Fe(II) oxygenase superfamily
MIQLTRNGLHCSADLEALREEFAASHTLRLPQLLSTDIMGKLLDRMERGKWIDRVHPGISKELQLEDAQAWQLLHFVISAPDFLSLIERITSFEKMTSFRGRIYRMLPGQEHRIPWHDDMSDDRERLVGMSVNLSPTPYSGGVFQLRRRGSREILRELPNVISTDAILFRISPELLHRVTAVNGAEPKTSFAGWFKSSGGNFLATVKRHASL